MAVSIITYSNKVALNENQSVADINKVKADDMNEIKTVVNNNATETSKNTTDIANISGTILWTNPNPTSAFASQTVTLSSDDYDMLEIFYYDYIGTNNMYSTKFIKGNNGNLMAMFQYHDHGYIGNRLATYKSDISYTFSNGVTIVQSDSFNRAGTGEWCIPLYIIGYKTGLFS